MSSLCRPLFIHGWATDSRVWNYVLDGFSEPIVCSLPGHGMARRWQEPGLEPAVGLLVETLNSVEGDSIVGIGWSLGAKVILKAVMDGRVSLRGIILVGATPSFVKRDGFPYGQPPPLVRRMLMDLMVSPVETIRRFYPLNFTERELSTPGAKKFLSTYGFGPEGFEPEDVACALRTLMDVDLREGLGRVRLPVLILHGTEDGVCLPGSAEYLEGKIDGARLEWFRGCGHAPFIAEPERFVTLTKRFMETL